MAFWSQVATEPQRQFRWYIDFASAGFDGMRYLLKKAAKPTMKISEVQHKYLNHFYYYPGRLEWEPISLTFVSGKVGSDKNITLANSVVYKALKESGYIFPNAPNDGAEFQRNNADQMSQLSTISKKAAVGSISGSQNRSAVKLVQIDAEGKDAEVWYLFNAFFTDVKFDSLEYGSEEIMNIDCTLKFDHATLNDDLGKSLVK